MTDPRVCDHLAHLDERMSETEWWARPSEGDHIVLAVSTMPSDDPNVPIGFVIGRKSDRAMISCTVDRVREAS